MDFPRQLTADPTLGRRFGTMTRKLRFEIGPGTEARKRYGPSSKLATAQQLENRNSDGYYGAGRYKRKLRHYAQGRRHGKRGRYSGGGLYTGSGGFWSDAWSKTQGLRNAIGGWARASANPYVAMAGRVAQATGIGDYETGQPVAVTSDNIDGGTGTGVPQFAGGPNIITISHREYISDIYGPDTAALFQNTTYGLNPGLTTTFPWLAQVAANYEEYTFRQLIFTYRSSVSDFVQTNGQVGTITMATQYNSNDTPFQTKQDAMEYDGAISGKVSINVMHGVECDPAQNSGAPGKYTRSGPVPQQEDIKTFDLGQLNVCVSNTPPQFNNQALGELWVSYTVELRKPKFFVTRGLSILRDCFMGRAGPLASPAAADFKPIDQLLMVQGQQNRMGCQLLTSYQSMPPAVNTLYLVLPATLGADFKIRAITGLKAGGPDNTIPGCVLIYPASAVGLPVATTPAITPISDMFGPLNHVGPAAQTMGWSNMQVTNNSLLSLAVINPSPAPPPTLVDATWGSAITEAHWHVITPTSANTAVDNVFVIQYCNRDTQLPFGTNAFGLQQGTNTLQLDIEVYNVGLNYSSTHQVIMEDPETGLVERWPGV